MAPIRLWRLHTFRHLADLTHWLHGLVLNAYHDESIRLVRAAMQGRYDLTCEELYPHTDWNQHVKNKQA